MSKKHIENSLSRVRDIFQKAADRIEALKPGGAGIPATVLANDIAKEYGMTGPQLYPTLLFLIKGYPNVEVRRGAKGGIYKIAASKDEPEIEVMLPLVEPPELEDFEEYEVYHKEELPIINT